MPPYLSLLRGSRKSLAFPSINQLNQEEKEEEDNKQQQQQEQINLDSFFPNSPLPPNRTTNTNQVNSIISEQRELEEEEDEEVEDSLLDFDKMLNEELFLPLANSFNIMSEQDLSIYSNFNQSISNKFNEKEMVAEDENINSINLEITTTISNSIDNSMKLDLITTELELPEVEEDSFVFEPVEISSSNLRGKNKAIEVETLEEISIEKELQDIEVPMLSKTVMEGSKSAGRKPRASLAPLPKPIIDSTVIVETPSQSITVAEPNVKKLKIVPVVVPKYVLPRAHPAHPRRLSVLPSLKELPLIILEEIIPEVLIKKPYLKRSAPISTNETLPLSNFSKSTRRQSTLKPLSISVPKVKEIVQLKSALSSSSTLLGIPISTLTKSQHSTTVTFAPILPSVTAFSPIVHSTLTSNNRPRISLGIDLDLDLDLSLENHQNDMSEISLEWSGHKGKGREEMGRMTSTPRFERILNRESNKDVGSSVDLEGRYENRELEQKVMRPKPRRSEIVSTTRKDGRRTSILLPPPPIKEITKPVESILQESTTNRRASRAFIPGESYLKESKIDYQPVASTSKSILPILSLPLNESQIVTSNFSSRPLDSSTNRRASRAFNSPPALRKSRLSILPSTTSLPTPLPTSTFHSLSTSHIDRIPLPPTIQEIKSKTIISSKPELKNGLTLPSGFGMESRVAEREEERRRRVAERETVRLEKERDKENELSKKRKGGWSKPSEVKRVKVNIVNDAILPPSKTRNSVVASTRPARSHASQISANRRRSSIYNDNNLPANELTKEALSNLSQLDSTTTTFEKKVSKYLQSVRGIILEEEEYDPLRNEQCGKIISRPLQQNKILPNRIVPSTSTATVSSAFKFSTTTRSARQPLPILKETIPPVKLRIRNTEESHSSGKLVNLEFQNKIGSSSINTIQSSGSAILEESRSKKFEWDKRQKAREEEVTIVKEAERKNIQESAQLGLKRLRDNLNALQSGRRQNRV